MMNILGKALMIILFLIALGAFIAMTEEILKEILPDYRKWRIKKRFMDRKIIVKTRSDDDCSYSFVVRKVKVFYNTVFLTGYGRSDKASISMRIARDLMKNGVARVEFPYYYTEYRLTKNREREGQV